MKRTAYSPIACITLLGFFLSFVQPLLPMNQLANTGQAPAFYVMDEQAVKALKSQENTSWWKKHSFGLGIATGFAILIALALLVESKKVAPKPTIHTETFQKDFAGPIPEEIDSLLKEAQSNSPSYKGILLHGPHGGGKTHLVRCISGTTKIPVKEIQASDILYSFWGESERRIQNIFASARALVADKENNPSGRVIVFLDKINDLAGKSKSRNETNGAFFETIVNTIAQELDKTEQNKGIIVIGCTENQNSIDSLLTSAGRLSTHVKLDAPNGDARKKLFQHYVTKSAVPHLHAGKPQLDHGLTQLADITAGKTAADIKEYVEEAARKAPEACRQAFSKPGYRLGIGENSPLEPFSRQGKQRKDFYAQQQIVVLQPGTQTQYTPRPVITDQLLIDIINRKRAQHPVGYVADIYA